MARFSFGLGPLRPMAQRTAQVLSRPFRMMAEAGEDAAGPGWYESSRELDEGLVVQEDFGGDEAVERWRALERDWQRLVLAAADAAQRRARTAAPSSITASA